LMFWTAEGGLCWQEEKENDGQACFYEFS